MAAVPRVSPTDAYAVHYILRMMPDSMPSVGGIRVPASIGTPSGKRYSALMRNGIAVFLSGMSFYTYIYNSTFVT